MVSEVMSFVCSDSCKNGITKEKVRTKGSGELPFSFFRVPFSEYLGFQSNGLEFSKSQILGRTCATIWWKKKRGSRIEKQNSKKGFEKNEYACIVEGVLGFRIPLPVHTSI